MLLIRDYGVAGWWAFAIPNVVGAAALAWVIRSKGHSEQLVQAHRPAIRLFSIVTLAFHVFFIRWIMLSLISMPAASPWAKSIGNDVFCLWPAVVILPFLLIYFAFRGRADRWVAAGVLLISLLIAWIGFRELRLQLYNQFYYGWPPQYGVPSSISLAPTDLPYLAAVMVFGFLLCPYLDQTFHRARQRSIHPRPAFALGFGVFFAAMIVMTLGYSHWLYNYFISLDNSALPSIWGLGMGLLVYIHLLMQSGITMELHLRDMTRPDGHELKIPAAIWLALAYAGGIFASLANPDGEGTYRIFMGFYALIFPAYVLICMQPWRKVTAAPGVRQWAFFAGAVLLAGPLFLMGITGENRMPMFCGLLFVLVLAAAERVLPAIAMRNASR
ncbi:MAG TPA: hypothetical protein VHY37_11125 [Tepidisphaeraceae bacterium]|nr:hypothetical protein [Tepidisphaeraceae bacterium]